MILAPHCDDVPLSLGGTLLEGYFGTDVHVVIVYSKSRYTKDQRGDALLEPTTSTRKKEEMLAAISAGYSVSFLDFGEPFVRAGFDTLDDICDEKREPQIDPVWPMVLATIETTLKSHDGLVLAPLGCGSHVDHRMLNMAFRHILNWTTNCIPALYEDLPYAANCDPEVLRSLAKENTPRIGDLGRLKLPVPSIGGKRALLSLYESQMTDEYSEAVTKHWLVHRCEHIWVSEKGRRAIETLSRRSL